MKLFLLTLFWVISYIFAIAHTIKYKSHAIPAFSVSLNFAWEIVATIMYKEYVGIAWLVVDVVIVYFLIKELTEKKNEFLVKYSVTFALYALICIIFFNKSLRYSGNGYIFLSFAMDLVMAVNFIYELKKKYIAVNILSVFVAVFRILGDTMAWVIYWNFPAVAFLGFAVFAVNLIYLLMVFKELAGKSKKPLIAAKGKRKAK